MNYPGIINYEDIHESVRLKYYDCGSSKYILIKNGDKKENGCDLAHVQHIEIQYTRPAKGPGGIVIVVNSEYDHIEERIYSDDPEQFIKWLFGFLLCKQISLKCTDYGHDC